VKNLWIPGYALAGGVPRSGRAGDGIRHIERRLNTSETPGSEKPHGLPAVFETGERMFFPSVLNLHLPDYIRRDFKSEKAENKGQMFFESWETGFS
jgi:hypothetical protein